MGSEPAKQNAGAAEAGSGWYQALALESQRSLATDAARRGAMQRQVADVVALEQHIEQALEGQVEHIREPAPAAAAVRRFHAMVRGQRLALQARLERLGGDPAGPVDSPTGPPAGAGGIDPSHPLAVANALRDAYTAFNRAAISYTMLHHAARVYFDTTTGEVAGRHLGGYAAAAQEINQLMAEVVAWGFRQQGQRCLCLCPSCALGACLCVASTTTTTNRAWGTTAPSPRAHGVPVVRTASCPATLDLQDGDVLTAVDGQAMPTYGAVLDAIVKHAPGEPVQLQVDRGGVPISLTATRP